MRNFLSIAELMVISSHALRTRVLVSMRRLNGSIAFDRQQEIENLARGVVSVYQLSVKPSQMLQDPKYATLSYTGN